MRCWFLRVRHNTLTHVPRDVSVQRFDVNADSFMQTKSQPKLARLNAPSILIGTAGARP